MTSLKFIIALLTISFCISCKRTYSLSDKDYDWMPYHGDEILVFSSNTGDTDTIFLLKKDTIIAYPEAQMFKGKKYEVVKIFCRHSSVPSLDDNHRYLENDFVDLQKSLDRKARLLFHLSTKDATFYDLRGVRIDSFAQQASTSLKTKTRTYTDVYIVDDEDWLNFRQRSDHITKLYWSKSEGLIRYDKKNGFYWELTKKYSR